jgi:tetrahedral aminopeptidase
MSDILPFLKTLITLPGLSGYETPVANLISEKWRPLVDEVSFSRLGSVHGLQRGTSSQPRPAVMLAAHMDAIGLMVTGNAGGFLHVARVGGIDVRVLPGALVTVHGRQELPGVVVQPPPRLLPAGAGDEIVPLEHLLVDVGLPPRKLAGLVRVGDLVSFANPPVELAGEALAGHSLDNRASVAALTACLEELRSRPHSWDVWAVATVQEETGLAGAYSSTFHLRPAVAVVLDVTWGRGPGASEWNAFPLGKGPTLTMGPNIHPALHQSFKDLADRLEIPYAQEYTVGNSGTDATATQVTTEGIPSMVLGLPLRYMHTPVEVVAVKDIRRLGRLMAEFVAGLEPDFIDKITWDN